MKLTENSLASGLGLATAIAWIVCSVFLALFPELALSITEWWMHGITLPGSWGLSWTNFILGGITMTISAWLFGYILGWSLKYFNKR